jgi:hypothetical protein
MEECGWKHGLRLSLIFGIQKIQYMPVASTYKEKNRLSEISAHLSQLKQKPPKGHQVTKKQNSRQIRLSSKNLQKLGQFTFG